MLGQELKILFIREKAYLTTENGMSFDQLDLPKVAKSFIPSYWKVKVSGYYGKQIYCEVLSYHIGTTQFEENQQQLFDKLSKIQIVTFRNIDTLALLRALERPTRNILRSISYSPTIRVPIDSEPYIKPPFKQTIRDTFFVALKNVRFKLGGVSFEKKFDKHTKPLELTILNNDIQEEFDAIKNYFANVLKTKKIKVFVNIEIIDHEVNSMQIKSPEIERIDKNLIDNVKIEFVRSTIRRKINIDADKNR